MTIKHLGGIFGRNPTFEEVVVDDEITANKGNFVVNDAATNTVSYPLDVHHTTTGSAANGFGVGINFNLENSVYNITDDAAKIEAVSVSAAEIADNLVFKTKWNATLADRLVLRGRGGVNGVVDLDLIYGNLKVADGFGIDFGYTSGTGTSELFDDYEEGTWTPTIAAGSGTFTTVSAAGRYTKTGRMVIAQLRIFLTDSTGGSGWINISNFPFANSQASYAVAYGESPSGQMIRGTIGASSVNLFEYDNTDPVVNGNYSVTLIYEAT